LCGIPLPAAINDGYPLYCSECLDLKIPFEHCRSWGIYEGNLREIIRSYKFKGERSLAHDLSGFLFELLDQEFYDIEFDFMMPVPSHRKRKKERGFDHIQTLCLQLSQKTGIELVSAEKIRDTPPQKGLSLDQRRRNLKDVFRIVDPEKLNEKNILIVDDICTTGTTISELAVTAKKSARVRYIGAVTVARVPRKLY
jgi:ComF family protein